MNIEDLTIKEAREIARLFQNSEEKSNLDEFFGKFVIVRSYSEGVNAGYIKYADHSKIILTEAKRLWRHRPLNKNTSWYEGVAESGLSDDSVTSAPVSTKVICENYSFVLTTEEAKQSIISHVPNKQK